MLTRNNGITLLIPVFSFLVPLSLLYCLLICSAPRHAEAEQEMRVAIASLGKNSLSHIGPTATRSPYYLIFTASGRLHEVIGNPYRYTKKGTGACVEAMTMLAKRKVTHVVAESFGARTSEVIRSVGMQQVQGSGEVQSVLDKLLSPKRMR